MSDITTTTKDLGNGYRLESTTIIVGNKPVKHSNVSRETLDEIKAQSKTPEWQAALLRLHNDPEYLAEKLKELDDEFDSQNGNNE